MRSWVKVTIATIWICTAVVIVLLNHIHMSTPLSAYLTVREISFKTNAPSILSPADVKQVIATQITGLRLEGQHLKIKGNGAAWMSGTLFAFEGEPPATCTFYQVRSEGIQLSGDTVVKLLRPEHVDEPAFTVKSRAGFRSSLSAQPELNDDSGFVCTQMQREGSQVGAIEGKLSRDTSIYISTANDAQIDFRATDGSQIGDTQIAVLGDIRFSHIEPGSPPQEKTVLLPPSAGRKNELVFESVGKTMTVNGGDLLLVRPGDDFYIRQFAVNHGIDLDLHGSVKDVLEGAGPRDLRSQMPSLFDELDDKHRIYTVIPGVVALVLGILEKMGVLPRN